MLIKSITNIRAISQAQSTVQSSQNPSPEHVIQYFKANPPQLQELLRVSILNQWLEFGCHDLIFTFSEKS